MLRSFFGLKLFRLLSSSISDTHLYRLNLWLINEITVLIKKLIISKRGFSTNKEIMSLLTHEVLLITRDKFLIEEMKPRNLKINNWF